LRRKRKSSLRSARSSPLLLRATSRSRRGTLARRACPVAGSACPRKLRIRRVPSARATLDSLSESWPRRVLALFRSSSPTLGIPPVVVPDPGNERSQQHAPPGPARRARGARRGFRLPLAAAVASLTARTFEPL